MRTCTTRTIPKKNFKWIKGEENISKYYSSEHVAKTFCRTCGSNLISLYDDRPDYIGLPIGGLDQDPGARPIMHVFVGSKSPWYEITDDLPQHEELPQENVV